MDAEWFEMLVWRMAQSATRRAALGRLGAASLGIGGMTVLGGTATARRHKKHKRGTGGKGGGGGGTGGGSLGLGEICEPGSKSCQSGLRCDAPTTQHQCSSTVDGIDAWCCVPPGGPCTGCECCGELECAGDGTCRRNRSGGACETSGDCGGNTPTCCGGSCVDVLGDSAHCGGCDSPCPDGETCGAGICSA